jgi:TolB protein
MNLRTVARSAALLAMFAYVSNAAAEAMEIISGPNLFAPGIASTEASEVRLTLSPDGKVAAWFTRNRPGGAGGYDIWTATRTTSGAWGTPEPASFNSAQRDFDPAFSADGRYIYFCSDRPGGLGGDDLYRVAVTSDGFGQPEHLGPQVNSAGSEWAPMLSGDGNVLLFSSNGRSGKGRFDLFSARRKNDSFALASPLPGAINTAADEFDATFLSDGTTVVFARAPNLETDRIVLALASLHDGRYDAGTVLPEIVNAAGQNTYGPMLDWSRPDQLTISSQRPAARAGGTDLYVLRYRLIHATGSGGRTTQNDAGSARTFAIRSVLKLSSRL